jgi:uncharacterized protein (DUF362 family)
MPRIFGRIFRYISAQGEEKPQTSRKDFLRGIFATAGIAPLAKAVVTPVAAAAAEKLKPRVKRAVKTNCDLAVVKGADPAAITRKAIEALGGMGRFVRKGDVVVVKPNIGWNRAPEYAANTNPEVVAAVVKLCYAAGARKVKVFDKTCNDAAMCYANSGIPEAVKKAGGQVSHVIDSKFIPALFPAGSAMESWPLYRDAVECDCLINVPIAKHHGLSGLTLSMKNLMGVCGGNRGMIHVNIDRKLAEITKFMAPDLTIIDGFRMLMRNGPSGGNLKDVKMGKTVIAGTDPVLADSYAATLFDREPGEIGHIRAAEELGVGSANIARAVIRKIVI